MGFNDVVFLPPHRASFSTAFLKNCGRGEVLEIETCLKTVVWDKQGHAPHGILFLKQSLFLCQLNFMEVIRLPQS